MFKLASAILVAASVCLPTFAFAQLTANPADRGILEFELQQKEPCLDEAERASIHNQIEASQRELIARGALSETLQPQIVSFGWPLQAAAGLADPGYHGISGFVDHNAAYPNQRLDYNCGNRTYDLASGYNHAGTDYFTYPFPWYKMDNDLVEIVAVADGTIVLKSDGNYDRNCAFGAGSWNAVYVQHADGSVAWYGHMKNGSPTAKTVGQTVVAGEYLGIVGSSGNSTGPHLHLEVYDNLGALIDPYAGSCNPTTATSWWAAQRPYWDSALNQFRIHATLPQSPGCGTQEIIDFQDSYVRGDTLYAVAYFRDTQNGQPVHLELRDPAGALQFTWDFNFTSGSAARSVWSRYVAQSYDLLGTWTYSLTYVGITTDATFELRADPFSDQTAFPLAGAGSSQDVSWVDFDSDGDSDVFVVADGQPNKLYRNDGGTWADVASTSLNDTGSGRSATWGDYDNDGDEDVYVANYNGANQLLRNDGGGVFTDVSTSPVNDAGPGQSTRWADVDNDGDLDLYLVNNGQPNKLFRNDAGSFIDITTSPLDNSSLAYDAAFGDYDDDGDLDLYLGIYGANKLLRNDGGGSFTDVTTAPLDDAGIGYGVAWGDYDGDHDLDLYIANYFGPNSLLRNDGGLGFVAVSDPVLSDASNTTSASFGDYDNDGDLDLYLVNTGAANKLLRNDSASWSDESIAPVDHSGGGQSAAWSDADGDGDLDLYLVNYSGGNAYFQNDAAATGNHWLQIHLVGVESNRSALGARVRLVSGATVWEREHSNDAGSATNSSTVALGLGSTTSIDSLIVHWPSGAVQVVGPPSVDTHITLYEYTGTAAPGTRSASALGNAHPNPFNPSTTITYSLEGSGWAQLVIYDVAGRRVRTLHDGPQSSGDHETTWNGHDDSGRAVASGVYLYKLTTSRFEETRRMVLLK